MMQDHPVKAVASTSVGEECGVLKVSQQACSCKTHHKQADKAVEPNRCKHMQTSTHNVSESWCSSKRRCQVDKYSTRAPLIATLTLQGITCKRG